MKTSPQHIVIVCSRLDLPGGTERAIVNLANLLNERGENITVLILDETADKFYPLHPSVSIAHFNLNFGIGSGGNILSRKMDLYHHIRHLEKIFKKLQPDFIIGTEYHLSIASWLAGRKSGAQILSWEHHHLYWLRKNRFWNFLFRKIYPRLDYVVCQNSTEQKLFRNFGCNATVIPYVLPVMQDQTATLDAKQILTVGWLIKRKGVDLIPAIAAKVFARHADWHWKIIGKGEEYQRLKDQITQRGLNENIILSEPVSGDLRQEYLATSLYVMTSRSECLPMVLLEATSFGIPCIAFDCPTGPADIIYNGEDGFLVGMDDVDAMSEAIRQLIEDPERRKQMGAKARGHSERYRPEKIYAEWKALFAGSKK